MIEGRDSRGRFIKGTRRGGFTFTCKFCGEQKPIEEMGIATEFFPPLSGCKACLKLNKRTDKDTAEVRSKQSAIAKKCWQDPEYRAKQSASHIGKHPTAEARAKISASLTRWYSRERGDNEDK